MELIEQKDNYIKINIKLSNSNIFYEIKISLISDKIYFKYTIRSNKIFKSSVFKFEEFQIINKLFTIYDNINEIFQSIKDIIIFKNPDIIKKEDKLYLKIYPNIGKYKFIEIPLEKEQELQTIKVDENFLNQIEKDIKTFDSFVDSYENNIKQLEKENEELQSKFNNYDNNFFYYNINNSYENYVLIQSQQYKSIKFNELLILEKKFFICNLIISKFKNKKINFKLIYKAIIDGDKAINFHNNVDGKGPLIILIKTSNNIIIGGYTSKVWSSSNNYMKDHDAFLFSLTNKEIYVNINSKYACLHLENEGPCFGNNYELKIVNNCLKENSWVNNESNCYNFGNKNLINEKTTTIFKVIDYEVYQIISYN